MNNFSAGTMHSHITSTYNTGYQVGDIKGAFLSDTDATNVTGTELVSNYDFTSGTTGWTLGTGYSISGGLLSDTSSSSTPTTSDSFALATGTYIFTYQATGSGGLPSLSVRKSSNDTAIASLQVSSDPFDGVMTKTFNVTSAENYYIYIAGTGFIGTYDYISVRIAELDRSVNNKGLQVYGTITKTPVATGADLVAYSGFNATNYLRGYMNISDPLSNFYLMGWFKHTNDQSTQQPVLVGDSNTYVSILRETVSGDESWGFSLRGAGGNTLSTFAPVGSVANVWTNIVLTSRGSNIELWVNGELIQTVSNIYSPFDWTNSTGIVPIQFGANPLVVTTDDVAMSLVRFGESVPSAEQIKKIYEDEKVLFQENAACTLYGSSDAVTALAYDDFNDLLHVGTSSGRSDFQGLRRINNTTTAVSTAISASNGLIAEQ